MNGLYSVKRWKLPAAGSNSGGSTANEMIDYTVDLYEVSRGDF